MRHHGYASCLLHRRLVQCLIQLFRICIPLCRINCKSLHQNSFFLRCDHKSHRRWRHKSVLLCPLDGMRHLHPGHASIHRRTKRIYIGIRSNLRSRCHLFDWRISTLLHAEIIIISIHSRSAKSISFTFRSCVIMILSGLISRWITPRLCTPANARITGRMIARVSDTDNLLLPDLSHMHPATVLPQNP